MAAFFKLALRIHKHCHILLSNDSHRESRSAVDDAVYVDNVLLHRSPLHLNHFQKTYKNVADAKTTSATSAAILRGHLHIICMKVAGRRRTIPDGTVRKEVTYVCEQCASHPALCPVPCFKLYHRKRHTGSSNFVDFVDFISRSICPGARRQNNHIKNKVD